MIRPARPEDLSAILDIYAAARRFMTATGNPHQWKNDHPATTMLTEDIAIGQLFVEETDGAPHGVFALIVGPDPTYAYIEDGDWLSNSEYGTIHRLASDGTNPGFFHRCVTFCRARIRHLRVDTHRDNRVMQHLAEKEGFTRCGIIYLANGDPRIAYERTE